MKQRDTPEQNLILYRIWIPFILTRARNFFRISVFSNVIAVIVWDCHELKLKRHSKPRIQLFCVKPVLGYQDFSFARFKCLHSQIQDNKGCEPFLNIILISFGLEFCLIEIVKLLFILYQKGKLINVY